MIERNAAICAYYQEGHKASECASKFRIGRQRVLQIIKAAGVWKPYVKNDRTKYVGVNVSEPTKEALELEAERRGISVSKLASEALDGVAAIAQGKAE